MCPPGTLPRPRAPKVTGTLEMLEETEDPVEFRVLPQSRIVQDALQFLSNKTETNRASPGTSVGDGREKDDVSGIISRPLAIPFYTSPSTGIRRSRAGISEGSTVTIKVEQLNKWEGRLRALTNICSHIDWFNAANLHDF